MSDLSTAHDKIQLRRDLRSRRRALSPFQKTQAVHQALEHMKTAKLWQMGRRWAFYLPFGAEFDCRPLVAAATARRKRVYFPLVRKGASRRMVFVDLNDITGWRQSGLGMLEPIAKRFVSARRLDVVCVPLLGFDRQGHRLGQGGGYYDTTFAFRRLTSTRPRLVGLAFACQEEAMLPTETWDVCLDRVVTENEVIVCRSDKK